MRELIKFNLVLGGRETVSGSAEIMNHGELQVYLSDKDRPLLLDLFMTCNIKKATLALEIEQARPWVEPSAEVRDILAQNDNPEGAGE